MAITATNQAPADIVPANARIMWSFTSDKTLQPNFRYVLDVYVNGAFTVRLKQLPNPSGYCLIDIGTIASSVLSSINEFPLEAGTPITGTADSCKQLFLRVGEEWSSGTGASSPPVLYNGFDSVGNPAYGTKTIRILNGYLDTDEPWDYDWNGFTPSSVGSLFMTDVPRTQVTLQLADHFTLQYVNRILPTIFATPVNKDMVWAFKVLAYNSAGTAIYATTIFNDVANGGGPFAACDTPGSWNTAQFVQRLACGPADLPTLQSLPGLAYYTVQGFTWATYTPTCTLNLAAPYTELFRINVEADDCSGFEPIQFEWLNKYGGFDYYTFVKRNTETWQVNRSTWSLLPGDWSGQVFSQPTWARGSATSSTQLVQKYTAQTDWLTEEQSAWLAQLAKSPDVRAWIGGVYTTVTIDSVEYAVQTYAREKMFQYEIAFSSALAPTVQNL
jgi:hypothetical protein